VVVTEVRRNYEQSHKATLNFISCHEQNQGEFTSPAVKSVSQPEPFLVTSTKQTGWQVIPAVEIFKPFTCYSRDISQALVFLI